MISTRQSGAVERNPRIEAREHPGSNRQWLANLWQHGAAVGAVVLLGGTNVVDFRLRVAQAQVRHDLLPSFWSHAGLVVSADAFLTVALDDVLRPTRVPSTNAIVECAFADCDDPVAYPNIAVIDFATAAGEVVTYARRLQRQRGAVDLPRLAVEWLSFVWGVGGNPLVHNVGVPSAAFVETAFGIAGIELTPGVASVASCPEAIWQSALWWHEYYAQTVDAFRRPAAAQTPGTSDELPGAIVPAGAYLVRQPAAAVVEAPPRRLS
jgi:hypothetical protein